MILQSCKPTSRKRAYPVNPWSINNDLAFVTVKSFYKNIRKDALTGELQVSALKDAVRSEYKRELAKLQSELGGVSLDALLPIDLDTLGDSNWRIPMSD